MVFLKEVDGDKDGVNVRLEDGVFFFEDGAALEKHGVEVSM